VPLRLSLDAPVLHASSVVIDGQLAAFIGPGGSGKSTLAVGLGRLGHAIGSDDGLMIRGDGDALIGIPAYPGARLWRDAGAGAGDAAPINAGARSATKLRFRDGLPFAGGAAPLTRLYVLDPRPTADVRFEALTPRTAVMALIEQTYRLALEDRASLARQLDALT